MATKAKFYIDEDSGMCITGLSRVKDGDEEVTRHSDLWKLGGIEMPNELVADWERARHALDLVEDEILRLDEEQSSGIQRAKQRWMAEQKKVSYEGKTDGTD